MDTKVKIRFIDFSLLITGMLFLIICKGLFPHIHVLVPLIIEIITLLFFNYFVHKLIKKKIIFYITEFVGLTLFLYGYLGILGFIIYCILTNLLYNNLANQD